MNQFLATETLIIELLLVVSLVVLVVRRLRVPYTVAPVVAGGLGLSLKSGLVFGALIAPPTRSRSSRSFANSARPRA